jgi:hypothetical protein
LREGPYTKALACCKWLVQNEPLKYIRPLPFPVSEAFKKGAGNEEESFGQP